MLYVLNRQFLSALGTTASQDIASTVGRLAGTETMGTSTFLSTSFGNHRWGEKMSR